MFDSAKTLADNLKAFQAECEKLDPECSKIFFENLATLQLAEPGQERAARAQFNAHVKAALEALAAEA